MTRLDLPPPSTSKTLKERLEEIWDKEPIASPHRKARWRECSGGYVRSEPGELVN